MATANGPTQITLTWTAPDATEPTRAPVTGYRIMWRVSDGEEVNPISPDLKADVTRHPHTGLSQRTLYNYFVLALSDVGQSGKPDEVSATTHGVPTAPQNLDATRGDSEVTLNWEAPADNGGSSITNYQYSYDDGTTWTDVPAADTNVTVSGLTNGTEYTFEVRAVNEVGGGKAASLSAVPLEKPNPPTGLTATATATANGANQIDLIWTAPAPESIRGEVDKYLVYRWNGSA